MRPYASRHAHQIIVGCPSFYIKILAFSCSALGVRSHACVYDMIKFILSRQDIRRMTFEFILHALRLNGGGVGAFYLSYALSYLILVEQMIGDRIRG